MPDKPILEYHSPTVRPTRPRLLILRACLVAATLFAVWLFVRALANIGTQFGNAAAPDTAESSVRRTQIAGTIAFISLAGLAITFTDFKRARK